MDKNVVIEEKTDTSSTINITDTQSNSSSNYGIDLPKSMLENISGVNDMLVEWGNKMVAPVEPIGIQPPLE